MPVFLSEVRRQPNEVEGPHACRQHHRPNGNFRHDTHLYLSQLCHPASARLLSRLFFISSRLIVKDRDLLKPRMKIAAYNQHDVGSFSESLGLFFAATAVLAAIEPTSLCGQESEAPDKRSRKPALSEAEGDPRLRRSPSKRQFFHPTDRPP